MFADGFFRTGRCAAAGAALRVDMGGVERADAAECVVAVGRPSTPRMLGQYGDLAAAPGEGIAVGGDRGNAERDVPFGVKV